MPPNDSPPGWDEIEGLIKDASTLNAGRKKLVIAALRCFAKKGYSNTSVDDIAVAAGISIGSVYKYVRAKEDVLWLISELGIERTNDVLTSAFAGEADARTRLLEAVAALIRQGHADRRLFQLLYVEFRHLPAKSQQRLREQEESIVAGFSDLIAEGNAAGVFNCPDPRSTAITIDMFTSTWAMKPHLFGEMSIEEYMAAQQAAALRLVGAGDRELASAT
jgi:AcrR family transcriptional regulator